jgi:predicted porin
MDAGYQTGKEYGQSASTVVHNGSRTTAIKFIGVEDLGAGLKAKFQFESDPAITAMNGNNNNALITNVATTSTIANGTAQKTGQSSAQSGLIGAGYNYVGIESVTAGEFQFGTLNTNTLATQGLGTQKFGTAIGSGYKKIWAEITRYENAFKYISPVVSGFQATYLTGVANDSAYGSTTTAILRRPLVNELGLNFDQGPWSAKYSYWTSKTSSNEATAATTAAVSAANVTTSYGTFAASYDFGVAKVAYGMQTGKNNAGFNTAATPVDLSLNSKAQQFTVSVPSGAMLFMANIGNRVTNNTTVTALNGAKSTFTGLGAHYNFSKNTYVYLMYERATMNDVDLTAVVINGAAATNTAGAYDRGRSTTAIGFSQAF